MSVVDVRDLVADAGSTRLLGRIDLDVAAGRVLAVLGDSGAGKSTLGLALLGECAPGVVLGGRVSIGGTDLLGVPERERRRRRAGRVGHLPQHPGAVLDPVRRVGAVLRELAALVHRDRRARDEAVAAALETARLAPELARRFPHQLSGGQQQRAALAQTLVTAPAAIVLDEPTTGLDPITTAELVDRLRAVAAAGTALVLLTHDHDVARALADDAVVLSGGAVVRRGSAAEVIGASRARPSRPTAGDLTAPRLVVRDMRVADTTGRPVLHGIDLRAARGELLAVVGESGAGKTTLGRCLAGLVAGRGTVEVDGRVLAPACRARRGPDRRAVQYVHQDPRATFREHVSVLDQVARPAVLLRGLGGAEARREAERLLERLGVDAPTRGRRPRALSGGQLQRAAVARALVARPAVLVCDEVTSALDPGHRAELLGAIDALRRADRTTVVLISHDLPLVAAVADSVVTLGGGRLVPGSGGEDRESRGWVRTAW